MMTLARLVGIDVPATKLIDVADIRNLPEGLQTRKAKALAIERFDRRNDGTVVHFEDFAQVFRVYPHDKYEKASYMNIASVISREGTQRDIDEFIRRLTFNALIGNADMHLKNWAMSYPDGRRAALAPAYDLVSTVAYILTVRRRSLSAVPSDLISSPNRNSLILRFEHAYSRLSHCSASSGPSTKVIFRSRKVSLRDSRRISPRFPWRGSGR